MQHREDYLEVMLICRQKELGVEARIVIVVALDVYFLREAIDIFDVVFILRVWVDLGVLNDEDELVDLDTKLFSNFGA